MKLSNGRTAPSLSSPASQASTHARALALSAHALAGTPALAAAPSSKTAATAATLANRDDGAGDDDGAGAGAEGY